MNLNKKIIAVFLTVIMAAIASYTVMASTEDTAKLDHSGFAEYLGEVKTCQAFSDDPVSEADVEVILNAGINAQSGMNRQDWHFTAVTSLEIQDEISNGYYAPLIIVISCGEETVYDAGLATQAMNSAALALGYATKIVASPTSNLNGENREYYHELLKIPEDMSAVGLLLIGTPLDVTDGVTGASGRNPYDEMTTILK